MQAWQTVVRHRKQRQIGGRRRNAIPAGLQRETDRPVQDVQDALLALVGTTVCSSATYSPGPTKKRRPVRKVKTIERVISTAVCVSAKPFEAPSTSPGRPNTLITQNSNDSYERMKRPAEQIVLSQTKRVIDGQRRMKELSSKSLSMFNWRKSMHSTMRHSRVLEIRRAIVNLSSKRSPSVKVTRRVMVRRRRRQSIVATTRPCGKYFASLTVLRER